MFPEPPWSNNIFGLKFPLAIFNSSSVKILLLFFDKFAALGTNKRG